MLTDPILRVRRFNRAVTARIGALDDSFLGRGRPLGPARVLWSIGADGREVADLRLALGLDSGLLSRILRRLEAEGLVTTGPSGSDRRRRVARLTPAGVAERAEYDRLNDALAADMLARMSVDPEAMVAAMDRIALALNRDQIAIAPADPETPEAVACLAAYRSTLADRIPGFRDAHVPLPDPEAAAYRPPVGTFLVAASDGLPVACVSLKTVSAGVGEVKRLWVDPAARGMGLARRMMQAVEDAARDFGMASLRLDTNENLPEAIALYRKSGWADCPPFTGAPATHWFTKAL
jgi:DNA-binding MarR family transcriptional regulator/ribosomal protein S18 acetylase RimI-like enzyme